MDPASIKLAIEAVVAITKFVNIMIEEKFSETYICSELKAAKHDLEYGTQSFYDESFRHRAIERTLTHLESVYSLLSHKYDGTTKYNKITLKNKICFYIAMCHRIQGNVSHDVMYEWLIKNTTAIKGSDVMRSTEVGDDLFKYVLGDCYSDYMTLRVEKCHDLNYVEISNTSGCEDWYNSIAYQVGL